MGHIYTWSYLHCSQLYFKVCEQHCCALQTFKHSMCNNVLRHLHVMCFSIHNVCTYNHPLRAPQVPPETLESFLEKFSDDAMRQYLLAGVGVIHDMLSPEELATVNLLFSRGAIQARQPPLVIACYLRSGSTRRR
jgi:hypothetical protein